MKFAPLTRSIELYDAIKRIRINVDCIVDSGSAVSLINFTKVTGCTISPLSQPLALTGAFGGTDVEMIGEICLYLYIDSVKRPLNFIVVDNCKSLQCIIGWPDIQRLKLTLSHEGILTKERRLFGWIRPNQINLIEKSNACAVYKVDIAHSKPNEAIDLGNGVYESAVSGLIKATGDMVPVLVDDFTETAHLRAAPTKIPKTDVKKVKLAIEEAWKSNKFQVDASLPQSQRQQIKDVLLKYSSCISIEKDEIGNLPKFVEEFVQEFDVAEPPPCPVYPVHPKKAEFLCNEINTLCKMQVLKETKTQVITSNLLAVPKKNGDWRAVSDLRWVNKHTKPTNLVLSRLDQIANKIMGKRFYVSLDVQKAYWSVRIPENQKKFYTIQCAKCWKTYAWQRMVMGAKNAATVFSHMIQLHVVGDLHDHVTTYIDDITFSVDDFDKGIKTLETLLSRIDEFGLKIGISKLQIFCRELDAFGFHFSSTGMEPMEDRIAALTSRLTPTTKKDLHSALASLNYFRGFIPNFSANAAALYALTSEKTEYSQEIVNEHWPILMELLRKAVKIQCPDYSRPMILSTDASCNGLGAVLSQEDGNGGRRILGVHSMGLNSSEKLWAIAQKELKGIFEGLVKFEHLLMNQPVIIETDNNSIYFLLKLRIGSVEINRRLPAVRFLLYISSFNFEVRHVSGKQPSFLLADFLSRQGYTVGEDSHFIMGNTSKQPLLALKAMLNGKYDIIPVNMVTVSKPADKPAGDYVDNLMKVHRLDKSMEELHNLIRYAQEDSKFCRTKKANPDEVYIVVDGILYRTTSFGPMIVCPKFYSKTIIKFIHEAKHESIRKTLEKLSNYKIWIYQKYKNVIAHVQNCRVCDPARSGPCLKADNRTIPNPRGPMDILHIDLLNIGPTFVLVAVDSYSRFIMTRMMKDGTSLSVKHALIELFTLYGLPHTICQDNGSNLNSAMMKQFFDDLGITVSRTTVNNHMGNSIAEASVLKIQRRTRQLGTDNGHMHLNLYLITHKINLERTRGSKFSPFEIMFKRTSSWCLQLPDLTKTRRFAQDNDLKNIYDLTKEIQEDMTKMIESKRSVVLKMAKKKPALKKNDHVRIKKFITDDNKKSFRPFSETVWRVTSVNPFTNTCLLQEITTEEFQPRLRKIHTRYLRRVSKKVSSMGDDLELMKEDAKELNSKEEEIPELMKKEAKELNSKEEEIPEKSRKETEKTSRKTKTTRKPNQEKTSQPMITTQTKNKSKKSSLKAETKGQGSEQRRSSHGMQLRNRKQRPVNVVRRSRVNYHRQRR